MHTVWLFCAIAMALAQPAWAWTADELVAKTIEARGGLAKIKAIKSLRTTGRAVWGYGDSPVHSEIANVQTRAGQMRNEFTIQGLTSVEAIAGKDGWEMDPFGGRREPRRSSPDEVKSLLQNADIDGPLVDWKAKGHKLEYLGTEDIDGTMAHKLRMVLADGDTEYFYLDPDYFLEIRVVMERKVRGVDHISETDYGNYAQVGGVWMALALESGRKGGPKTSKVTLQTVEINVATADTLFAWPTAGTPVLRAIVADPKAPAPDASAPAKAQAVSASLDSGVVSGLRARNIGSAAMSGRVSALTAYNAGGKTTVYVGAASGGVWKSSDGGTTFKPVFDKQPVQSIGAVAVDPGKPQTVWVGTGEAWTRNSVSAGNGIYKSSDGGATWAHMGLHESERITKIVVHPSQGDTVFACVPGKLWSDSTDRGLYRTTDGGKNWSLVLKGPNASTGCSGVTLDPKNPLNMLAGTWDFRRKGWSFRSGGDGPESASGSAMYASSDGGATWTEASAKGLPAKPWGRIEVVMAPSNAKIVYALIEAKQAGLFRSDDGGQTWSARDNSQWMVWRPFYFQKLIVDPSNPDHIFKPDLTLLTSEDGGKSVAHSNGGAHGDWHDVWVDPDNPKHVLGGDDGGFWSSKDGGNRWWKGNNLPISQFYHVAIDDLDPYRVYGGLQDNSSWVGHSAYPGGITNAAWQNLYDGDGFWTIPDPFDPDIVYAESQGGFIGRIDRKTHTARDIQPKAGQKEKLRFNWNAPIVASKLTKGTIYLGGQFVFRSKDRGQSWERISPDLTTNDPAKQRQEQSGGITVDNSSAEMHTTLYALAESPLDAKQLWAGSDDGNVQVTTDAGKAWTNVTANISGLPPHSWVSWLEPSRHDKNTLYAAFDRHTFGDFAPWVFKTTDLGKTWAAIAVPGQGVRGWAHVIRQDPVQPKLLFLGTEFGLWMSNDDGKSWAEFHGGGFPAAAVREVQVHGREHDLVIGTHGRGIWIVDDISPLRALTSQVLDKDIALLPGRAVQQRLRTTGGWSEGDAGFTGENPAGGAALTYYQRTRHLFGPLTLEVLDAKGEVVDTLSASKRRGLNRVQWTMQVKPPRVPRAATLAWSGTQAPRVLPGTYTVRLAKGSQATESQVVVGLDRRASYTVADRKAQYDAAMRVHALFGEMSALVDRIEAAGKLCADKAKAATGDAATPLKTLGDKVVELKKLIVATKEGGAITGEERLREHADMLYSALLSHEGKPTAYQLARIEVLSQELAEVKAALDALLAKEGAPLGVNLAQVDQLPGQTPAGLRCSLARLRGCEVSDRAPGRRR